MDVHLEDNRLVLVGENGTGKSTFANLIYYFLSKQWARLRHYRFARIEAHFSGRGLKLTPKDLADHFEVRQHLRAFTRFTRHIGPKATLDAFDFIMELTAQESDEGRDAQVERVSSELRLPRMIASELIREFEKETKGKPTRVQELERAINEIVRGQFLYLPTYRRIEHDLRSIFRGVEIEGELRKFREHLSRRKGLPFIELVEFGMEDVEQTIAGRMAAIKESVRNGLNSLTGTYLREVIRGVHTTVDVQRIGEIAPASVDAIFARIDEITLPTQDKERLKGKMAAISSTKRIEDEDKVIAHFLSRLIEFYTEQQANEKNVREFVRLCNEYLTGKRLVYDNAKYTIYIDAGERSSSVDDSAALPMKALSSGEKQIVSLFSHLYLSGESRFFVVIDEPELSLSVPWQRRFLPDILEGGMCEGLIAVTHSPFVWDNQCEQYVKSLAQFTSAYSDPDGLLPL